MDLLAFIMALKAQGMTAAKITEAVNEYLQDHPDALDQAAVEAIVGEELAVMDDELDSVKSALNLIIPYDVKQALYTLLQNCAFANDAGYESELLVVNNWVNSVIVVSISAVYTQSHAVYENDGLDSIKSDLVVTAYFDNETSSVVTNYTLSGTLTVGTSVITVGYGGRTTSITVQVSELIAQWILGKGFNNTNGLIKITTSNTRAIYALDYDPGYPGWQNNGSTGQSGYYPARLPDGAVGIKVLTPADVYVTIHGLTYTSNWYTVESGWLSPLEEHTYTFTNNPTHFSLTCKHGNAGTATVTQADVDGITYEFVY